MYPWHVLLKTLVFGRNNLSSGEDLIEKYLSFTCILGLLMPRQLQTLMSMAEVQLLLEQIGA